MSVLNGADQMLGHGCTDNNLLKTVDESSCCLAVGEQLK